MCSIHTRQGPLGTHGKDTYVHTHLLAQAINDCSKRSMNQTTHWEILIFKRKDEVTGEVTYVSTGRDAFTSERDDGFSHESVMALNLTRTVQNYVSVQERWREQHSSAISGSALDRASDSY